MVAAILGVSIGPPNLRTSEPQNLRTAELVPVFAVLQVFKVPDLSLDIVLSCLELS